MTYKLIAMFALPWALMAILGVIDNLGPAASDGGAEAVEQFGSAASNPNQIQLDEISVGTGEDPLGGVLEFAGFAKGWLSFAAKAAFLKYDYFEGDLAIVRWLAVIAAAGPLIVIFAKESLNAISSIAGGLFRLGG